MTILQEYFKYLWAKPGEMNPFGDLQQILIAMAIMAVIIFALRFYYRKSEARKARWLILYQYALKKKLDDLEMAVLKSFFNTLSYETAGEIVMNKKKFRTMLYQFLASNPELNSRTEVQVYEKLFPEIEDQIGVVSLNDLHLGEVCSVESADERHFATLVKIKQPYALLSIPDAGPETPPMRPGEEASLFIYRPTSGGYLFSGTLHSANNRSVVFHHSGKIGSFGEQHWMADLSYPVEIAPWPDLVEKSFLKRYPALKEKEDLSQYKINMTGMTDRVSDRAALFHINFVNAHMEGDVQSMNYEENERIIHEMILKQDVWEMKMMLPDEYNFSCRCRIVPPTARAGFYIVKYIDPEENARRVLFAEIKKNNPTREMLT